jgi:hypothetical protein
MQPGSSQELAANLLILNDDPGQILVTVTLTVSLVLPGDMDGAEKQRTPAEHIDFFQWFVAPCTDRLLGASFAGRYSSGCRSSNDRFAISSCSWRRSPCRRAYSGRFNAMVLPYTRGDRGLAFDCHNIGFLV